MVKRRRRALIVMLVVGLASSIFQTFNIIETMDRRGFVGSLWAWGLALSLIAVLTLIARMMWLGQTALIEQPITVMELTPLGEDDDE